MRISIVLILTFPISCCKESSQTKREYFVTDSLFFPKEMSTFQKIENISLCFHFGFGLVTIFCLHFLNVLDSSFDVRSFLGCSQLKTCQNNEKENTASKLVHVSL